MLGIGEIIFFVALVVLLYNIRRLPELVHNARKIGKSFKEGISGEEERKTRDVSPPDNESKS